MPRESSNDALVRRQRELRALHIKTISHDAAEHIVKMIAAKKPPRVEQIAQTIETEFKKLPG